MCEAKTFLQPRNPSSSNHAEDRDQDVGSKSNGEAPEGQPTNGAFKEEVYDSPDDDDVIFSEFADKILAMAQDLVQQNSKYSTNEILKQSLNITIAAATQLCFNKLSGWQVAIREEKGLVATDLRQPESGTGNKGR
ncbi:hypothetical protein BDD12DRAFT_806398 [Trichophaea hybrida]|nr:hypothetical protein BDD12DRAFT_806398 [Trichophaea hybrida]